MSTPELTAVAVGAIDRTGGAAQEGGQAQGPAPTEIRAPLNWRPIFDNMSEVQKKVHLLFREVDADIEARRESLLKRIRYTYEEALRNEVREVGCGDPGRLHLGEGKELRGLNERAKFSSKSIVNTFNYDLAQKIVQIRQETPTANRWVYAYRLNQWEPGHWADKDAEIAMTETGWAINQAKQDFYARNDVDLEGAEVRPFRTACPVCASYVAGNPYRSVDQAYRLAPCPVHPRCPHYVAAIPKGRLDAQECRELWMGE